MKYENKWQKRSAADTMRIFGSDPSVGLTEKKVSQNRRSFGENLLWDPGSPFMFLKRSGGMSLLGYGLMIVASICAYIFGVTDDLLPVIVSAILCITVIAVMYVTAGLICMHHARKWIPKCSVIRDGKRVIASADELVPGDIIYLCEGDICPADVKIISSEGVLVNESFSGGRRGNILKKNTEGALVSVDAAHVEDFIYAASEIISGECTCVVCLTGKQTLVYSRRGAISLTSKMEPPSLKSARRSGSNMATVMLIFSFFAVIAGIICPLSKYSLVELVLICLALAVSVTDDLLPAAGYLMYAVSMSEASDCGLYLRDINGAEFIANSTGIVSESSDYMKLGKTRLVSVYCDGNESDDSEKIRDILSLIYAGTSCGDGKYGGEVIRGIRDFVAGTDDDPTELFDSAKLSRPVIDSISSAGLNYTIFAEKTDIMFSTVGSIESVLSMCTRIRTGNGDVPLDRKNLSDLLESASKASEKASLIIGVAVRRSPYNNLKRLSVLTSDLTFVGFVALDSLADETLCNEITEMKNRGKRLVLLTDGSGEDVNFARRMGLISSREDIVSGDINAEKMFTEGVGGAMLCESSESVADALKLAKKQKSRLVFLGGKQVASVGGFSVISGEEMRSSAAFITDRERGAILPLLRSIKICEIMERRFRVLKLCLTLSAFLRGIYALTAVFGSMYVYSTVFLFWSALIDGLMSAVVLLRPLKKD